MKEFENLTPEEKKYLMTEFLGAGNRENISFQQWYELEYVEMNCFNGK